MVFVTGGFPGDRVRARVTRDRRAYAEARVEELLEPGPDRVPPVADHPGAPWQELRYERQLEAKQAQVEEALRRIGHLEGFALEPILPAEQTWRYRNKLEYSFGRDDSGQLVCGFHAPGRFDVIEPLDDCLLASEAGNAARDRVLSWCRGEGLSAYDRREHTGLLRNLVVRLRISPEAFFQTNTEMAERLYGLAGEYADLRGFERVFDLYCGIGTVGLTLAPRAAALFGLEIVESAVADAIENARRNEVDNASFYAGDVRLALRELAARAGRPDVLVVDPPRAGLSKKVVRRIVESAPRRIVYVSCNPTTLAPDAAQLAEAGWALRRVRPVDMFPQTPHIECVALLERAGS